MARKIAGRKGGEGKSASPEQTEKKRARRKARRKKAAREPDGTKKRSRGRGKKQRAPAIVKQEDAPVESAPAPKRRVRSRAQRPSPGPRFPERIGRVVDFDAETGTGRVAIEAGVLRPGDTLHFQAEETNFFERIERVERDGAAIERAVAGNEVSLSLTRPVREGVVVYTVTVDP